MVKPNPPIKPPYFQRRLSRAFTDTIGPLGWNLKTLFAGVQTLVAFLLLYWAIGGTESVIAEMQVVAATLGAFAIVFIGNFIWNYAQAPKRMQKDADDKIEELESTIEKVSNKQSEVDVLSALLSEGINRVWNREINSEQEFEEFRSYWEDWRSLVIAQLEQHFTQSDVIHFSRLGVIPIVHRGNLYEPRADKHSHILMQYALQEQRLREIIRDHNVTHIS